MRWTVHCRREPPAIELAFTQEMEGQFPVEILYERIMAGGEAQAPVPTLSVPAAEVEHGRIAVEALAAVEVRATWPDGRRERWPEVATGRYTTLVQGTGVAVEDGS